MKIASLIAFSIALLGPQLAAAAPQARIVELAVLDKGSFESDGSIPQVDVVQDVCSVEDTVITYEPFFDSVASIRVVNSGRSAIRFSKFWYRLTLDSQNFAATIFPPSQRFEVLPGKSGTSVLNLFLRASAGSKFFSGSNTAISDSLGPKALTFYLEGRDGRGKRVRVQATTTVVFSNYDRCGS